MTVEPILDREDNVWFAGVWLGLPTGPWSQRGEFYAFPDPRGWQSGTATTVNGAEAYETKAEAQRASDAINRMTEAERRAFDPEFYS